MRRTYFIFIAASLICAVAFIMYAELALAHSLYIQSGRHRVAEGKKTPLFFAYGHHLPVDDGVRAKKLASVKVFDPAGNVTEFSPRDETGLQSQMVEYGVLGTYVLTAETNPGFYTVWKDEKGKERHSIKPMSALKGKAAEIIKSLYSKQYAKSYVVCGDSDGQYMGRVGLPLELVPVQDPTAMRLGDVLVLKVFKDGRRHAGTGVWSATYNGFSTEAEDMYHPATEVTGDTLTIPLNHPGRWYIRYSIKSDTPDEKKDEYMQLKQTATLVILVPNERKTPQPSHK